MVNKQIALLIENLNTSKIVGSGLLVEKIKNKIYFSDGKEFDISKGTQFYIRLLEIRDLNFLKCDIAEANLIYKIVVNLEKNSCIEINKLNLILKLSSYIAKANGIVRSVNIDSEYVLKKEFDVEKDLIFFSIDFEIDQIFNVENCEVC